MKNIELVETIKRSVSCAIDYLKLSGYYFEEYYMMADTSMIDFFSSSDLEKMRNHIRFLESSKDVIDRSLKILIFNYMIYYYGKNFLSLDNYCLENIEEYLMDNRLSNYPTIESLKSAIELMKGNKLYENR